LLITFKINNSPVLSYTNVSYVTNVAPTTNGTIMLGYSDPWDDVGDLSPGNGEGKVIYDNVSVVAISAPVIITNPTSVVVGVTSNATFSVVASTITGITNYQWYLGNNAISGATNSSYTLTASATNYGSYSVVVSDGAYSTLSAPATATPPAFVITVQPANQIAVVGGSATFSVTAPTFSGVTNYQWSSNAVAIVGGTNRTITLSALLAGSFGNPYSVVVNDGFTTNTSANATVVAGNRPALTSPVSSTGKVVYTYNTQVGPNYVVEFKTNLNSVAWVPYRTNAGTGGSISVTNSTTNSASFFRVRLQ